MLHIILLILKIIGWILLAILGLIVLLICIVLFVPLCYHIEGKCKGDLDSLYGKIQFSWLFHLVGGLVEYDKGNLDWVVRIAWKKIREEEEMETQDFDNAGPEKTKEGASQDEEVHTESKEFVSDVRKMEELLKEQEEERSLPPTQEAVPSEIELSEGKAGLETQGPEAIPFKETVLKETVSKEDTSTRKSRTSAKAKNEKTAVKAKPPKKSFFERLEIKIQKLFEKFKYTFEKICDTIKSLADKKEKLTDLITDEVHRNALAAVLKEIKRILRRLKPKRMEADIEYGFTDPYLTGQVLAALSMVYPFVGEHVNIQPDFENKVLTGQVFISGKIRVLPMAALLWHLVWNKNVRITFKHIRNFKL